MISTSMYDAKYVFPREINKSTVGLALRDLQRIESFRAVHEYHHHNMAAAASYGGLLLGGARGLGHHTSHHAAHHAHAAATYKEWTSATPSQSLVDASSAPPYPHGHYAPLSGK